MNYQDKTKEELLQELKDLENKYNSIVDLYKKRHLWSETNRNSSGENQFQKNNDNSFLTAFSFQLTNLLNNDDIIKDIALPQIKQYTGASYAHFSIYDAEKKALTIQHIETDATLLNIIIKATGKKIFETVSPVSEKTYKHILTEKIGVVNSLTELSFGAIPPKTDNILRDVTGFYHFYPIAHINSGKLYGITVLAFKKNDQLPSADLLEMYSNLLSVTIKRKHSEQEMIKAKEKAEENEKKYRRLADNVTDVVWITDLEMNPVYISPSVERVLGVKPEDFLKRPLTHTYPPASIEKFKKTLTEQFAKEQDPDADKNRIFQLEIERYYANGTLGWDAINATFIRDEQMKPVAIQGVSHDITERKQAEEALRKSEATNRNKLKAILEPEGDIETLNLADIIDTDELQTLMEDLFKTMNMGGAILDVSGKVLVSNTMEDICAKFHRVYPETAKNCLESDLALASGVPVGTFKAYRCKNNMWDMVSPIMIGGKHLGNIYIGQFFYEDEHVDYELFRKQARHHGFDETEYLAALDRVPRLKRETVASAMAFYAKFAGMISSLSISKIKLSRDIAQRKKAEKALQEKNNLLKRIFDSNFDLVALTDLKGTFTLVGKSHEILGYDNDYLIGKKVMEFVHPDDVDIVSKEFAHFQKTGINRKVKYRYKRIDGQYLWFETVGSFLRDEKGNPEQILFNTRNVTERKKAEEALRSNYALLQIAGETARFGGWSVDLENNTATWSDAVADIHEVPRGYAPPVEEGINFYAPEWHDKITQVFNDCAQKGIPYNEEMEIITAKEKRLWVRTNARAVKDENGRISKVQGSFQDITERKQAELALKESEEKFKTIFNMSQSLICIADINTATFKFINPSFIKILGYSEQELLNKSFLEFIHPDDVKSTREVVEKKLQTGITVQTFENRYRCKNGNYCWLNWNSYPVPEKGITYAIAHDVTELKKNEKELQEKNEEYEAINEELRQTNEELYEAKEKAEEANRLKTEFLNNMSHEVRTPMNGIIGFSEMLDKPDITEEKRKYYSKIVQNSSHQLLRIIDDILEISTLETRQEKPNETELCLNDLLMELFSIFNLKSKEKNIPLYLKKQLHDTQSHIISDKTKLNKIIGNLIENALKFTSEGFIEFGYYLEKAKMILYVKDTGTGISPKNHKIVFERFSQEDKEISREHGGLGLGLSICKENAQLLGGDITLESEKGKGSTFYVTIPYKPAKSVNDNISKNFKGTKITNDKHTILVAEDEEVNYLYIEALFEDVMEDDFNLIHAKNGKEAFEICTSNKNIDLVLMDIKMPVMNGHEATEKIKSEFPNLPIIAQTAYSTESDKQFALKHGCNDFISKPIDKEKLFGMINKYLIIK